MDNDIIELIDMAYNIVADARSVPLGKNNCVIDRDAVLSIFDEIKAQLPAELAVARRLVNARNEFIGNAKREAESMRKSAEEQSKRLVNEQEVVRAAELRAAELVNTADVKSRELRRMASEYADDILRQSEETINSALDVIRQSRLKFRATAGVKPAQQPPANEPPRQ